MAKAMPDFDGFPEPTGNFTRIPNELLDRVMPLLTPYERSLLLDVLRQTWGWQKRFECIPVSAFVKRLGICKNTVMKGLTSLEKCHCILRYRTGRGSKQKVYYALNTATNLHLLRALQQGHITIEQAEFLNTTHPQLGVRSAPSGGHGLGAPDAPSTGSRPAPTTRGELGASDGPSQRTRKKRGKKETDPRVLKDPGMTQPEAADQVHDLFLTRKRLREAASEQISRLRGWASRFRSPEEE